MEGLIKFRYSTLTFKVYDVKQTRSLKLDNVYRKKKISLPQIPDAATVLEKFYTMKMAELSYKEKLLNELIFECTKNNYEMCQKYISHKQKRKRLFVTVPIPALQKRNLVSSVSNITNDLLSYLEPFPFDEKRIQDKEKTGKINVNFIRKDIEKGYLAWKYKVNVEKIDNIYSALKFCVNDFKSIRNLKQTVSLLETVPKVQEQSNLESKKGSESDYIVSFSRVAEKIYHINQKPFDLNNVLNFEDKIAGIIWHALPNICPKILVHSHQHILFVVSVLKTLRFTERQIQIGLPYIAAEFTTFIRKLNALLGNPKLKGYRNEAGFLQLLYFEKGQLSTLTSSHGTSFEELIELINVSRSSMAQKRVCSSVMYLTSQFYKINRRQVMKTFFGSKLQFVSSTQMYDTLAYLKEAGFTSEEVQESLAVVFYPRYYISNTLEKIKNEEEKLKKIGYKDGCIDGNSFFANGTKEKRKLLQLCLYYMEKPFNFSGSGVWITEDSDGTAAENEKTL